MNDSREAQLHEIARQIQNLTTSPLYPLRKEKGYSPVTGEGTAHAKIMLVGEAPGEKEAESGRPFVGASGKILDALLEEVGLEREDVYITNVVKDRPPENRDPSRDEVELYAPFLAREIEIIQPKVIATLGRFAMEFILNYFNLPQKAMKIGEMHGQLLEAFTPYGHVSILPLYHPANVFYNQELRKVMEDDFEALRYFVETQ